MTREYQYDFSIIMPSMYDIESRERKAKTMVAVLADFSMGRQALAEKTVLDVGSSTGIIDHYLSQYFKKVVGIDIDTKAVSYASAYYDKSNLEFIEADAMNLQFPDASFDVVICSQVYEHVPDSSKLMKEIYRVLRPSGVCYFSAGNRINLIEPHYKLPLLSVLPKSVAHLYLKLARRGNHYYEEHLTYLGLKKLTQDFICNDYTSKIVENPAQYEAAYMLNPDSISGKIAKLIVNYAYWAFPNYVWLLQKPYLESLPTQVSRRQ